MPQSAFFPLGSPPFLLGEAPCCCFLAKALLRGFAAFGFGFLLAPLLGFRFALAPLVLFTLVRLHLLSLASFLDAALGFRPLGFRTLLHRVFLPRRNPRPVQSVADVRAKPLDRPPQFG